MHERHRALTPAVAANYEEAASVCLARHHSSPVAIALSDNDSVTQAEASWSEPDARVRDAWANELDATRDAAYACVIAGVEEARGLVAVRRAENGTGADYYIGPPGSGVDDLESCLRLEVSGTDKGDERQVLRRLGEKVEQARSGVSILPAIAGVVGFAAKILLIRDVREGPWVGMLSTRRANVTLLPPRPPVAQEIVLPPSSTTVPRRRRRRERSARYPQTRYERVALLQWVL
jgi:hypothetical protein